MKKLLVVLVMMVSVFGFSQKRDTIVPIAYMEHQHYFLINHGVEDYLSVDNRFILSDSVCLSLMSDELFKALNKHQKRFEKSEFKDLKKVPDTVSVMSVDEYKKLLGEENISDLLDLYLSDFPNDGIKKSIIGFQRLYRGEYGTPIIDILEMAIYDKNRKRCTIRTVISFQNIEGEFEVVTFYTSGYDDIDVFHSLK